MGMILTFIITTVIPDVPDLAPDANRSMGALPDDPHAPPKRSPRVALTNNFAS